MATKVFINARFLDEPITGVQRWGREVLRELDLLVEEGIIDKEKFHFTLLAPKPPKGHNKIPEYRHLKFKRAGLLKSHFWEQIELPFLAKGFLINMKNTAPILKKNMSMLIHDLQPFARKGTHSPLFNFVYKTILPIASMRAKVLHSVSNNTRNEIEKYLKRSKENCIVTTNGHDHILRIKSDSRVLKEQHLKKNNYLLAVSSLSPNKNFAAILRAISIANIKIPLVIVGGTNPSVFRNQNISKWPKNVHYVGRVSDEELRCLYENATGFIYPSFYEGWGLPPGEAMLLGCPVIASNTSSLPEVCGEAALYCDPNDDNSIANQIKSLCSSSDLREDLIKKGLLQSKQFTWRTAARNFWEPIEKACQK